ncbi:uncharacterized protein F4822DRAFT_13537 [Hypoxylon trugodes]|uniref:uncharacterized protein n=1 Tax=Hypoxylon trugodes TaxID=326681 RepID=UPI0021A190B7|nr:uncharacterized protein F4822DRAFT_13537 [Hypoxylon trugodes]KAI1393452.1 hypothetical protein F4822DRAFT_13537 [Hypoxylon trugodes]
MTTLRILLPILALIGLTLANPAANLTTYMPECAQSCIQSSADSACAGPTDSQCLCTNMRRVGFGSLSCAQGTCFGNSTEQIALSLRSAFTQYCTDVGVTPSEGTWYPSSGWPGATNPTGMSVAATSSSIATTAPPATNTPTSESQQSASEQGGSNSGGNDLSRGAIAGIAVGGGVAVIAITGGLFFLAFRLGKGYSHRKKEEASQEPGRQEEGTTNTTTGGSGGGGDVSTPSSTTTARPKGELDGLPKSQLDSTPVSEMPTDYKALGELDPIKEMPTQEEPVELSANPYPREVESPVLPQTPWR